MNEPSEPRDRRARRPRSDPFGPGAGDAGRDACLREADVVVFVCSGNMVRSAFAELYARHVGFPREVRSCATTYRNEALYPETARALARRGLPDATLRAFRPTHVDELGERLARGGFVTPVFLGMRRHHLDALAPMPAWHARAHLLDPEREIGDPVLEGADFAATFARVEACVEELRERLVRG